MARIYGIRKRLADNNVDETLAKEIIGNGDLVEVTTRMEALLGAAVTHQLLDSCACGTGKKELAGLKEVTGETLKDKLEAITHLSDYHADWIITINQDETLTVRWDMKKDDQYTCACSAAVKNKVKVSDLVAENRTMPLTYCFCCAGHARQQLQQLLGLPLKTKEIISSPINSGGNNPCEFILEILKQWTMESKDTCTP